MKGRADEGQSRPALTMCSLKPSLTLVQGTRKLHFLGKYSQTKAANSSVSAGLFPMLVLLSFHPP